MQGASEQCMQATEMDFSAPTTPSFRVTTRRRFTPQGTSFSFLQAVTQPLHSMQRSESQMNFIRAIVLSSQRGPSNVASQLLVRPLVSGFFNLADRRLGLLYHFD